jgi:transcription elongation factor Elf1
MHVLRYIWPHTIPCHHCGHEKTKPLRTKGQIQYRTCSACGEITQARATHAHHQPGPGRTSVVVGL